MHFVDYVEWQTVADLLDRLIPDWSHAMRDIMQVGNFVAVTVALTLNGVTREGVGTGAADSETGIKKAEHDALKRAAVKFGIARDLYRDDEKQDEPLPSSQHVSFNPLAQTRGDMISPNQFCSSTNLPKAQGSILKPSVRRCTKPRCRKSRGAQPHGSSSICKPSHPNNIDNEHHRTSSRRFTCCNGFRQLCSRSLRRRRRTRVASAMHGSRYCASAGSPPKKQAEGRS
nr:Rad52/Rad22 family DNA repair protein [Nitrosomonas nitrosa]